MSTIPFPLPPFYRIYCSLPFLVHSLLDLCLFFSFPSPLPAYTKPCLSFLLHPVPLPPARFSFPLAYHFIHPHLCIHSTLLFPPLDIYQIVSPMASLHPSCLPKERISSSDAGPQMLRPIPQWRSWISEYSKVFSPRLVTFYHYPRLTSQCSVRRAPPLPYIYIYWSSMKSQRL